MNPRLVVLVAGTGTEVGKTWVSAALLRELRARGVVVAARKPAQSFEPGDLRTDAVVLAEATGDDPDRVCPPHRWYPVPMAPPMAAEALGLDPPTVAGLAAEVTASWPPGVDVGLVETAGGVASPQAADGAGPELAAAVGAHLAVLVADAGLGTIHAVRLAAAALAPLPVVVVLNRFDAGEDLHRRNLEWLAGRDGFEVVTAIAALADATAPGPRGPGAGLLGGKDSNPQ